MRLTFDPSADAAYLYLVARIGPGEARTQIVCEDSRLRGMVVLDLDDAGHLLGVEVIGATDLLRPETLSVADDIEDEVPDP